MATDQTPTRFVSELAPAILRGLRGKGTLAQLREEVTAMQAYSPVVSASGFTPPPTPVERELPFQFTGSAKEYFRIWIVNVLLTIVTLGVYSAWAKVRTKQYLYRHTWVDGTSFQYLADPLKVLKGRIIAAVVLGTLFAAQRYSLTLYVIVLVLVVLASPWVLVKSLAFNARNSAFRNIRFAFTGRAAEAVGLYWGMALFNVITCGLAYPYAQWRFTSFAVWRHLYGDQRLGWSTKAGDYYRAYLKFVLITLPAYAGLIGWGISNAHGMRAGHHPPSMANPAMLLILGVFYVYLLIPAAFLRAGLANLFYGGLQVGEHYFVSNQRGTELLKLYVVNALAMIFSLGLLIPWAKIRIAKYRASRLTLHAQGPLVAEKLLDDEATAIGEGLSDLGDFDLGIGV